MPRHSTALRAVSLSALLCACSSDADVERAPPPDREVDAGNTNVPDAKPPTTEVPDAHADAKQDPGPACTREPETDGGIVVLPLGASTTCNDGWWRNTGQACGPFSAGCFDTGDGLCYRLCATPADCPDPCAPACRGMAVFRGGDTPSTYMPVCQPGARKNYPAACLPALRDCWEACKAGGAPAECASQCWKDAGNCAWTVCDAQPCYDACDAAHPIFDDTDDIDAFNACLQVCAGTRDDCLGPRAEPGVW